MKSLSEIETTSKRASKAVGFSWGISEEIGKSVRLLEMFNFKGIQNLNEYFEKISQEKFEKIKLINSTNKSKDFPFCPITLGVNFLDQVKNLEKIREINFSSIAYPLLFLPFLSRSSEVVGKKILFKFDDQEFILNINVNIVTNSFNKNSILIAKNAKIIFLDNKDNFNEHEWKNLYKLSEKTFVEETESLKKGAAGAGLTDND